MSMYGRDRSHSPRRARRRSLSPIRRRAISPIQHTVMPTIQHRTNTRPSDANFNLTDEETAKRTIVVSKMSRDTKREELFQLFSAFGHIRDVRMLSDEKTGRSKGIAYVEFEEQEAVPYAVRMNGWELNGAFLEIMSKLPIDTTENELPIFERTIPIEQYEEADLENASQCFVVNEMYNPLLDKDTNWEAAIRNEVIKLCDQDAVFVSSDKIVDIGCVYVKCSSVLAARRSVIAFRSQPYKDRTLSATFIPLRSFHYMFPASQNATESLSV